jgi:hypothetical protein
VVESLLPFLKGLLVGRKKKKKENGDKMAEALSDTALTEYDQFDDYLEMVVQFGVSRLPIRVIVCLKWLDIYYC